MTKTTKIVIGVAVVLIIIVGIWYLSSKKTVSPQEKATIKIGAILPLTGDEANLGQSAKNAILLAQSQLAQNTKYNYEVIFEDDAMDPTKTSTALNKLVNIDKIDAVMSFTSGPGNVVSASTQTNKIIHFSNASDANVAKGDFNFIHWTPPEAEAKKLVEELKSRNITSIALIGMQQQGIIATSNFVKQESAKSGIAINYEEMVQPGTRDFKTIISKIMEAKPQIIVMELFSPELEILAKQIKELGVTTPLTTIESFEFTTQPELFEGYWYIQAAESSDKFNSAYTAKFNATPQLGSPYAYDSFNLIVYGFEHAGSNSSSKPTLESIVGELLKVKDFSGVVGNLTMQQNHIVWSDATVKIIKDGNPTILKK